MDERTTEQSSKYNNLEKMTTLQLLQNINAEDTLVPIAVNAAIPQIEVVIDRIVEKMNNGGRLFYIGAGTSGRLGIVDASECPPTYGVAHGLVIGVIAGGETAILKAVEFAEDDTEQGFLDLLKYNVTTNDFVIGIAASGTTPYVIGAIKKCNENGIENACLVCNANSKLASIVQYKIEVVVGPEFVTGSTRMKAGTAQKLVLNMITTAIFIKRGRVQGNKMVNMQLTNNKLIDRGVKMIMDELNINENKAKILLEKYGNVKDAISNFTN